MQFHFFMHYSSGHQPFKGQNSWNLPWQDLPIEALREEDSPDCTYNFLFGLIVTEWDQTLCSSFQIDVTRTLNNFILVQNKKEIIC